jgi:PEP-CTERM motif
MGRFLRTTAIAVALVFIALAVAIPAQATVIPVSNPSFETLPAGGLPFGGCGTNCSYSIDAIPGWTNSGDSGQFQPGPPATTTYFNSLSDGPTSAYSNDNEIFQTLAATVQVGALYTLLVDIGNRNDLPQGGLAYLEINSILYSGSFFTPPPEGGWGTEQVLYTGLAADAGQPLTIRLRTSESQGNFDNVRLTSEVPEPSTLGLIGFGLLGLSAMKRRRRHS